MGKTSIQITDEQREQLDNHKTSDEPIRAAIDRLLGNIDNTEWTEEEIREIARSEVRDVLQQHR